MALFSTNFAVLPVYCIADLYDRLGSSTNTLIIYQNVIPSEADTSEIFEVQTIADVAGSLGGTSFDFDIPADSFAPLGLRRTKRVWFNVDFGSSPPSGGSNIDLVEVNISSNDSANAVALALQQKLDNQIEASASVVTDTVTVTVETKGAVNDASAGSTGFTINVTQQGQDFSDIINARSGDILVTFSNFSILVDPTGIDPGTTLRFDPGDLPGSQTATATGTATWYALYNSSDISATGILGEVTEPTGDGSVFIADTTITSGDSITPTLGIKGVQA